MNDFTTPALVLREVDYKEADKLLTILTPEHGKLTVSSRACRRKNSRLAAASQLLVYSEMTLYQIQNRWLLRESASEQLFPGVREDIQRLSLASYLAELAELNTQEEVPAPEILSLLLNSLYALDTLHKDCEPVRAAYELKLMSLAGYEPILDACAVCGREPVSPCFCLQEGVLTCADCKEEAGGGESVPLKPNALAAMRHVLYGNPKRLFSFRLEPQEQHCMNRACERFVKIQLERDFRTLSFYRQFLT